MTRFPAYRVSTPLANRFGLTVIETACNVLDAEISSSLDSSLCSPQDKSARCANKIATASALPVEADLNIVQAIEDCRRAYVGGGALDSWGLAALPTLSASLGVMLAVESNPCAADCLFDAVKAVRLPGKAPVRKKTALLAVFLCRQPQTFEARKECGRFACLVNAARRAGIRPEEAASYLANTTLSKAVAETRKGGEGAKRIPNPIKRSEHPNLWAALQQGSAAAIEAQVLINEALRRIEVHVRGYANRGENDGA